MDWPGQVSYRPVDGAEAGDLCLNRITEQPPHCQQLVPFTQLSPPTKTSIPLSPSATFQRTKSQRNWLYKTHPEAFLGNLDLPSLISSETRAQKAARPNSHTGSILAIGDIVDLRNAKSSRIGKCPVVALAAGEAGHILQLSVINPEKWSWYDSAFSLGTLQTKFQGSWRSDGSPISKLEFATKLKQYDNLRWLIVQRETSTTILKPELRAKPVAATTTPFASGNAAAEHVLMNSVVTLTTDVTGGDAHSDFSANLGSNDLDPQLAIIDRSGNWSVWRIERKGHGRGKAARAVLVKKGISTLPVADAVDPSYSSEIYRVIWATRSKWIDEWERDSSPSVQSDSAADEAKYPVELDVSQPKYDGLVMCNHTQLQVSDIDGQGPAALLGFLKRDGEDTLLDARAFPGSSIHILVLTTDKLCLLDVSFTEGQARSPNVVVSCRHFRNSPREMLKLSVTKLSSSTDEAACLVSVHSAHGVRVDLFWLIINQRDGTAKLHHQVVHFPGLNTADAEQQPGIESLAAVPLPLSLSKGKQRGADDEHQESFPAVQLFQLYALVTDLSLRTTIVAISQGAQQNLLEPVKAESAWWTDERRARFLRRKWLRETEKAFVIPDQVEEVKPFSGLNVPRRTVKHDTIQLRHYLLRLVQEINHGSFGDDSGDTAKLTGAEYLRPIREALKSREEGGHVPLKPLLSFSNLWKPFELSALDDEVDHSLRRFKKSEELQLFECGNYGTKQSAMELFEQMAINWSAALPAEALKPSQWRYIEVALERMAAEVYLSGKGVYMAPQSTLDLAAKTLPREDIQTKVEDDLDSQPRSSQAPRTPSGTPSSSRPTSRATSEAFGSSQDSQASQDDEDPQQEDPAVARLRLYLPSIKFTPPPKAGPSRVISLWPEHRGVDPADYRYRPPGKGGLDEQAEAAQRRREKVEARRQRRAERRALLGIKLEGVGESFSSQPYRMPVGRSSPLPMPFASSQEVGSSQLQALSLGGVESSQPEVYGQDLAGNSQPRRQAHSQSMAGSSRPRHPHSQGFGGGFGIGSQLKKSQTMNFVEGFGFSQTMSQPLSGGHGSRMSRSKAKRKGTAGFK